MDLSAVHLRENMMRKKHSKSMAVLPLGIKNRMQTELPGLVALTAIGEPWFSETHQSDLLAVALVTRELATPDSLQAWCAAELQRLCERPITIDDKVAVAVNLAECLPWLQLQSNTRIERALKSIMTRCANAAPTPAPVELPVACDEAPMAVAA